MTTRIGIALIPLTLGAALAGAGRQDPDDEAEAKELGRRAFVENCLICHGEEMASRQRLTTKQWTAEVDKMIGWGAPVPADQKTLLLKYVAESFSEKVPPPPPDLAPADGLLVGDSILAARPTPRGDAPRGGPLYHQFCANCHGPAAEGGDLGPRLAGRAVLLEEARYHEVVRKGLRRMPGFANALQPGAEIDVLAWLRGR
jgi:ubiquinol-cytochrome c reductase cytochrome c subunit